MGDTDHRVSLKNYNWRFIMEYFGTLGTACNDKKTLEKMFRYGMTGIRLNLAHQSLVEASLDIGKVFKAAHEAGVENPDLVIDLRGPELRIGQMKKPLMVKEGKTLELGTRKGDIPVQQELLDRARPGQELLIDDGRIKLSIEKAVLGESKEAPKYGRISDGKDTIAIVCKVLRGGRMASRKTVTIADASVDMPTLTEGDKKQLKLLKQYGVTGVMLPFVRGAGDIQLLKRELENNDSANVRIFAKIETQAGYDHIGEIADICDMVVIARGDLGSAYPLWELPRVQKEIAKVCLRDEKPFMVTTQLLHSMERRQVPTRAEVSDIHNAVLDGASALMLTGETAIGEFPAEAMRYLVKTAKVAQVAGDPKVRELLDM